MIMKKLENLAKNELTNLDQIQGGRRVKTGPSAKERVTKDVLTYDRDGELKTEKYWYGTEY